MILFQPVYEYDKMVFGRTMRMEYASSIVFDNEMRARLKALETWDIIRTDDDTLINITYKQLVLLWNNF